MRKKILMGFVCISLVLLINSAIAEKTVKTIEGQLGYISQTVPNNVYSKEVTINPPDGITNIIDAQIIVKGDFQANTKILAKIGDQLCEPTYWQVPNLDVANYYGIFDCTELAQNFKGGNIELSFGTNQIAQNVKGTYRMTYYNNNEYKISLTGTDYYTAEDGIIFLQLLDENNIPLDDSNSSCFVTIYYPDKTIWQSNQLMTYLDEGVFFKDITIPNIVGIYIVSAYCTLPTLEQSTVEATENWESGTFSGGSGWIENSWNNSGAVLTSIDVYNGMYSLEIENSDIIQRKLEGNESSQTITINFYYEAESLDSDDDIAYINIIDSDGTLTNIFSITDGQDDSIWRYFSTTLDRDENNINLTGNITFQITTNSFESNDFFRIDNIKLIMLGSLETNATAYQIIRGSNELNVKYLGGITEKYGKELIGGELHNFTYYDSFYHIWEIEGYVSQNSTDQTIEIWTHENAFPCESVQSVFRYNTTSGSYDIPVNITAKILRNDGRCRIDVIQDLNVGEIFYLRVVSKNQWKRSLLSQYNELKLIDEMMDIVCTSYQNSSGFPAFTVPLTGESSINDTFYSSCYTFFDNFYTYENLLNTSFFPFFNINYNFTYGEIEILESLFNDIKKMGNDLDNLGKSIGQTVIGVGAYGLAIMNDPYPPINPNYTIYFANISTGWYNYLANVGIQTTVSGHTPYLIDINATVHGLNNLSAKEVWNFSNRTLTDYNQSDIFAYLIDINGTLYATPSSIWNYTSRVLTDYNMSGILAYLVYINDSVVAIPSDILDVNSTLYAQNLYTQSLIIQTNSSLYVKMNNLKNLMNNINSSLWNKLFSIQDELAQILYNQTTIYNQIISTNQTLYYMILNINQSEVDINTTELENIIGQVNQSIINKLDSMSIVLGLILDNQTNLKNIMINTNQSLYDKILEIKGDIATVSNDIGSVNDTILIINQTTMNKLYGIQDDLSNITSLIQTATNLIYNTNQTIMNYLFEMNNSLWQSIYDVWNNLNFTNITATITANLTDLPKETYLYFQTVEEKLQHNNDSCISNGTTHRKEILVQKCVAGSCFNITQQIDEYCQFGCSEGQCNPEPQVRFSIMIVAILLMLGFSYGIYQIARRT